MRRVGPGGGRGSLSGAEPARSSGSRHGNAPLFRLVLSARVVGGAATVAVTRGHAAAGPLFRNRSAAAQRPCVAPCARNRLASSKKLGELRSFDHFDGLSAALAPALAATAGSRCLRFDCCSRRTDLAAVDASGPKAIADGSGLRATADRTAYCQRKAGTLRGRRPFWRRLDVHQSRDAALGECLPGSRRKFASPIKGSARARAFKG